MQLLIESGGQVYDLSEIAMDIKYKSQWNNGAGVLQFSYPAEKGRFFENGATVRFTYNGTTVFFGFLFKTVQNKKEYKCTCYDQLVYFKAKNSIMRQVEPLDSFLNKVAYTLGNRIRLGNIDSTEINLSKKLFDNQTCLDMIYTSIEDNLLANTYWYTLYDNGGALDLVETLDMRLPLVIGDKSLATDFDYERSIADDTYDYIKVAKDDKDAGVRNIYVAYDASNIAKWGQLMLYEKVSANLNESQLAERANQLLMLKNRETRKLKVESLGDARVVGGSGVKIEIAQAGLNLWAVVDSVTHEFSHARHTMEMNLIFGWWS